MRGAHTRKPGRPWYGSHRVLTDDHHHVLVHAPRTPELETMASPVNALAVLGVLLAIPHLYRIVSFLWLYVLRPPSLKRYHHGPKAGAYALVTGATDGIGKATAAELLRNGFNLILHGRNEAKMRTVVEELRARVPEGKDADVRWFIVDAAQGGHDFEKMVEPFRDLHITLVYHNVGGGGTKGLRYVS
ncbi:hypothetical protein C8T65DRAFT_226448 [Cerioporus squamosus]|nr:hypothetical protein C8T65DRAFT_226448 [Cerioporus squamosus]